MAYQFNVLDRPPYCPRASWDALECIAPRNVYFILQLLADAGVQATFFPLGWVAQRHPGLVRAIVAQGHELASHGYGHERASDLTPQAFTQDIARAKGLLEDIGGVQVLGYRAPSFSIGEYNQWAFARLAHTGHVYSSSVYPVKHDHYGMPDAPRFAYRAAEGMLEVPPSTVRLGRRNLPSSGGGFFRLLPYEVSRALIRRVNTVDGQPALFYFHPWEVDPQQPRVPGIDAKTRFRHYVNLSRNAAKLKRLLADFAWGRMDDIFLGRRQGPLATQR